MKEKIEEILADLRKEITFFEELIAGTFTLEEIIADLRKKIAINKELIVLLEKILE